MNKRVVVFGTFDLIHEGHRSLFNQAKRVGDYLLVVVARDSYIRYRKSREPRESEQERLVEVQEESCVDEAILGDEWPVSDPYGLLGKLDFGVIALGYDQKPTDEVVRAELDKKGKEHVEIVRLEPYEVDKYKSSIS